MANRKQYCHTCGSDEEHRALDKDERAELQARLGTRSIGQYLVCTRAGCRHVRTGFNKCAGSGGLHITLRS
jgi:hypothetical protein